MCDRKFEKDGPRKSYAGRIGGILRKGEILSTRNGQACIKNCIDLFPRRWPTPVAFKYPRHRFASSDGRRTPQRAVALLHRSGERRMLWRGDDVCDTPFDR
ncbi:hypothetical protein EVAR_68483_1 [Eumeta japonica]|uniref:Uncharacterized protein n=1 Tax=Eumeta variegata TaxID=151549 RepID=A0A4C2AAY9_EUMVA|nr:hypothetical protein EVAR_68483_1 [Eumeta japonica]